MSDRLFLSPPHMGGEELEFIHQAMASNYIAPLGPMVDAFEKEFAEYVGIPHCLALASGTAAMHLALREIGVGPGDEVLASSLTFIGSITPAIFLGASVAFIDCDEESWNMDPDLLAAELAECARRGKPPKAVIPTDLYGQCCDLERIMQVCEPYGIPVVADAAEAMGAFRQVESGSQATAQPRTPNSRHAGFGAKAAVFSFNGNKIITTSGGGMLASDDSGLIEHARKLSQQAREPAPHYEHKEIGYNYRLSNILAAIGRGQLRVLDERVKAKRRIFATYRELLGNLTGIEFMPEPSHRQSNRWLTVVLLRPEEFGATSEQVRVALEAENIESRPIWKPMHLQPVFKGCRIRGGAVSERLFRIGLCLPSGTAMTDSDMERVARIIRQRAGSLANR
ncbi:MAG TPA: aminotransferase class I/II-fold pyridoxal phosphate-dependent enzyme [Candidatus Saccharimonadales bacterium]|nr:aminotransferase class I/II-fold pyridoxal phosphate-dependent enzyme [Candidatus Saccharimonadales bacterium]